MNRILILFIGLCLGTQSVKAQCSGCTTTISNLSANSYVVGPGQKLCITTSGTVTGLIAVTGGSLCNQGKIQTSKVSIGNGGKFDNQGIANIDSLLVTGTNSALTNSGTMTHTRMTTAAQAQTTNNGTVTVAFLGDTAGTYVNNGQLNITSDIYHGYFSQFTNNNYVAVGRDFFNSTNATFATSCVISVNRDWFNAATVTGHGTDCGGFNITGGSYNSGSITTTGGPFDICDAGNPPLHLDGNSGTIASGVTYCTCFHVCMTTFTLSGIQETQAHERMTLYPNPANTILHLRYSSTPDQVDVYNATGMLVMSMKNEEPNELLINTEVLAKGIYVISAKEKGRTVFTSRFVKD